MNCKDYLTKTHHSFIISYDDDTDEELENIRQRGTNAYTVSKEDYKSFERSMDAEPNFDCPQATASGLHGPQGVKGTYNGLSFDSKWEYAFYRYQTDICGHVVHRNKDEWFPYFDENGKQRRFYYDFLDLGQPVEIKGIWRPNDLLKKQATEGMVIFLSGEDIKPMIKELNNKIPGWELDYVST